LGLAIELGLIYHTSPIEFFDVPAAVLTEILDRTRLFLQMLKSEDKEPEPAE
jgi:hypothetical protein